MKIKIDELDEMILKGSGICEGKKRIYNYFTDSKNSNVSEQIAFLKQEYGISGGSLDLKDGLHGIYMYDSRGLSIRLKGEEEQIIKWSEIRSRITFLINSEKYLSETEKKEYGIEVNYIKEDGLNKPNCVEPKEQFDFFGLISDDKLPITALNDDTSSLKTKKGQELEQKFKNVSLENQIGIFELLAN